MAKVYSSLREASENVINLKGLAPVSASASSTSLNELVDDEGEAIEPRKIPTDFSFSTAKTFDQINERMPPWSDAERRQRFTQKNSSSINESSSSIPNFDSDNEAADGNHGERDATNHTPIVVIQKDDEKLSNGVEK